MVDPKIDITDSTRGAVDAYGCARSHICTPKSVTNFIKVFSLGKKHLAWIGGGHGHSIKIHVYTHDSFCLFSVDGHWAWFHHLFSLSTCLCWCMCSIYQLPICTEAAVRMLQPWQTDRPIDRQIYGLHAKLVDSDWRVINWISKQLKWIRGESGSENLPSQSELACCGKTNAPCWWPQPAWEYTKLYPTKLSD